MDLSIMILIGGSVVIAIALVFCFFGYKLARFLLPLCGTLILEALVYLYVYNLFQLNALGTWLFFGGTSVAIYIILFLIKRIAGFFAGLLGSALMLFFVVYAFQLQSVPYVYPAGMTISVVVGLLTVVYQRAGVIISTSLLGACTAAFFGLYIYVEHINAADFIMYRNVLVPLEQYLSANSILVLGASVGLTVLSVIIQIFLTGKTQVLSGIHDDKGFRVRPKKTADDPEQVIKPVEEDMYGLPVIPQKEKLFHKFFK